MAYCVKCGVELDESAHNCALCNTEVVYPREHKKKESSTPYPTHVAPLTGMEKRYTAQIFSIIFSLLSIVCVLINRVYVREVPWSIYPVGALIFAYIVIVPPLIFKTKVWVYLVFDSVGLLLYLYMIERTTGGERWVFIIATPIVGCLLMIAIALIGLYKKLKLWRLHFFAACFGAIGLLALCVDGVIHYYVSNQIKWSWSLILLVCVVAIALTLVATQRNIKIRQELHKRLHL